jgi:hypothetical protein
MFRFKSTTQAGIVAFPPRPNRQCPSWMLGSLPRATLNLAALFSVIPLAAFPGTAALAQTSNGTTAGTQEIRGVVGNALAQVLAGVRR